MDPQSKGIQTGRCVVYKERLKTCEVSAWCPIEEVEEAPRPALLNSAENFTVLIKNNIDFPGHNYTSRNILPGVNITCTFHKTQSPQCPIFRLGDIFQETGDNFSDVAIQIIYPKIPRVGTRDSEYLWESLFRPPHLDLSGFFQLHLTDIQLK